MTFPEKAAERPVEAPAAPTVVEVLVKLPMLYFALKSDRFNWKMIDFIEQYLDELAKVKAQLSDVQLQARLKRLKAAESIFIGLNLGSTRDELILRVEKCGYTKDYASKFVNEALRRLRIDLPTEMFREEGAEGNKNLGRPPVRHYLVAVRPKDTEELKELESISFLVTLMSGSFARLLKLIIRSSCEYRKLEIHAWEEMISVLCERRGVPDVQEEEIKNKVRKGYENFKESKEIDVDAIVEEIEWRGQKLEAIRKEAHKYLRLMAEASGLVVDWDQSESDPHYFEW